MPEETNNSEIDFAEFTTAAINDWLDQPSEGEDVPCLPEGTLTTVRDHLFYLLACNRGWDIVHWDYEHGGVVDEKPFKLGLEIGETTYLLQYYMFLNGVLFASEPFGFDPFEQLQAQYDEWVCKLMPEKEDGPSE